MKTNINNIVTNQDSIIFTVRTTFILTLINFPQKTIRYV